MTNFTEKPWMVRVDRFKERGKWHDTFALDMDGFYDERFIHDAVQKACARDGVNIEGFLIVVLEPYHKNAHPIMLKDRKNLI